MSNMKKFINQESYKYYEKINTVITETPIEASKIVAQEISYLIRMKQLKNQALVLGLATGSTPIKIYAELVRMHKEENLSFKNVITFNLDEYFPMKNDQIQSYHYFMNKHLFNHIDIPKENINIPNGNLKKSEVNQFCEQYEKKIIEAGGIDYQILGIGRTGHIGFNEPGSLKESTTRLVHLDRLTMLDAAQDFFGFNNVPKKAITMGVNTILNARQISILAFGENKASIVQKAIEGEQTADIPSSFLQEHNNVNFYVDKAASSKLTRVAFPWKITGVNKEHIVEYDAYYKKKAVIWLSQQQKKPITKLNTMDYDYNHLYQLLDLHDNINDLNNEILRNLKKTITLFPAGQTMKKILIFSPHPDNAMLCMGGTIQKLQKQGHQIIFACQTSGNIGIQDNDVERFANFITIAAKQFNLPSIEKASKIESTVDRFLESKQLSQQDSNEVLKIKTLIRKSECVSSCLSCKIPLSNIRFLNLPFYETGTRNKNPFTQKDVDIMKKIIIEELPDVIFAAGDQNDINGTHRICLQIIQKSLKEIFEEKPALQQTLDIFFYRGAWQEWEIEQIDLAIPMNQNDIENKRIAIFRHQSQKNQMLDKNIITQEFWQRVEERNIKTAQKYDLLGLPKFAALEVFVNYKNSYLNFY